MSAAPSEVTVVRRGRGTFSQALRSSAPAPPASSAVLPTAAAGAPDSVTDRFAFAFQQPAKDIDITGATEMVEAETVRVQLFRRERRRRQVVMVGDVPAVFQRGTCKLFGFRGTKPQRLQQKFIRMVHLALPSADNAQMLGTADGGSISSCVSTLCDAQPATREAHLDTATTGETAIAAVEGAAVEGQPPAEVTAEATRTDDDSRRAATAATSSSAGSVEASQHGVLPLSFAGEGYPSSGALITHANAPILTAPHLASLAAYLHDECSTLWKFEDVAKQKVQIRIEFGAAFVCSNSSYHRNLEGDLSVASLMEKLGDESLQLHFLGDCPACVSRAVEHVCRPMQTASRSYSSVRLTFFSSDRQTRTVAHALWNGVQNGFELTDVEGVGLSFSWTVFSLAAGDGDASDLVAAGATEAEIAAAAVPTTDTTDGPSEVANSSGATSGRNPVAKKTIAYPFSVSFRAFYKSRRTAEHGAYAFARAVLDKLTETEHTILEHGSASHYEAMDLSSIRDMNVRSQDFKLESIQVDHVDQRKLKGDLIVESASSLLIEGFLTSDSRSTSSQRQQTRDGLSYYRSRTNSVHWKIQNEATSAVVEANLAPLHAAMSFVDSVLARANSTGAKEQRVGRAPEAL